MDVATPDGETVEGEHGYEFDGDFTIDAHEPGWWADEYDFPVVPGGDSPERLRTEAPRAADIVWAFDDAGQPIAAVCHGAQLLISADVLGSREATGYWSLEVDIENAGATYRDEAVVVDDNLITSPVPDDLPAFMRAFFEWLDEWDRAATPPTPTA